MAVTAHEYVGMLKELLPPGPAWPRGDSTSLYAMMFEVWGTELARIDSRANALIKEADPRLPSRHFRIGWLNGDCRMNVSNFGALPTCRPCEGFCFGR